MRRPRFLRAKYASAAVLTLAITAISAIERTRAGETLYVWEISRSRSFLHVLAEAVPASTPFLWGLALLCGVTAFVMLRRGFSRIELVPATGF